MLGICPEMHASLGGMGPAARRHHMDMDFFTWLREFLMVMEVW